MLSFYVVTSALLEIQNLYNQSNIAILQMSGLQFCGATCRAHFLIKTCHTHQHDSRFFSICNTALTMLITTKQKKVSQQTLSVVRIKLTYFVSKENVTVNLLRRIGKCSFQIVTNTTSLPHPLPLFPWDTGNVSQPRTPGFGGFMNITLQLLRLLVSPQISRGSRSAFLFFLLSVFLLARIK